MQSKWTNPQIKEFKIKESSIYAIYEVGILI